MENIASKTGVPDSTHCTCCGRHIRTLADHHSLLLYFDEISAQRRGYRCINCGQVSCYNCSANRRRCACGGNAWIAMAYLDGTTADATAHR